MKYRTIMFDFDGTLADNSFLFLDVLNALSGEFGFSPVTTDEIPALRHMSAREILTERLGIPLWNVFKIRRLDRAQKLMWREKISHADIRVFPWVPSLMRDIRERGIAVGIVSSNLPEVITRALQLAGVEVDFAHAGSAVFGKARAIRSVLRERRTDVSEAVYVGDELRDLEACRAVGIPMIGVGWGLNAPEALERKGAVVVTTPEELRTKILQ